MRRPVAHRFAIYLGILLLLPLGGCGPQRGDTELEASETSDAPVEAGGEVRDEVGGDAPEELAAAGQERFVDNGDGTVTDHNTNLIWLQDAGCEELKGSLSEAKSKAAALASGACGLTDGSKAGDWRLPTAKEFCSFWPRGGGYMCPRKMSGDSLINTNLPSPSIPSVFTNVQTSDRPGLSSYWTSTLTNDQPRCVDLGSGFLYFCPESLVHYSWPVRSG